MKRFKDVLAALVVIGFMLSISGRLSYAQPNIPREKIPSDIPSDVREQFEKLYSSDPVERALSALNLGSMGKEAAPAIPFLMGMLGDDAVFIWTPRGSRFGEQTSPGLEAAKALVKIGEPSVQPLIAALKDKDWNIRKGAASALGDIKDPRAIEPLIATLKDKNQNVPVRMMVAKALGRTKDPRAVEPLIAALKDENSDVRSNVAKALGEIGKPGIEALIAALKDEDSEVRWKAVLALGVITGQNFGLDPAKWQEWWEENKGKFGK